MYGLDWNLLLLTSASSKGTDGEKFGREPLLVKGYTSFNVESPKRLDYTAQDMVHTACGEDGATAKTQ